MTIKLKLDLLKIDSTTFTESLDFTFESITDIVGFNESWVEQLTDLILEIVDSSSLGDTTLYAYVNQQSSPIASYVVPDIHECSNNGYLIFTCTFDDRDIDILEKLIKLGIVSLDVDGLTSLIVYKQNSENDALNKTLTLVNVITGKFNHSINLKNINIDLKDYQRNFNYVYIPILNRYYYVDSIELISADYSRLHLKEDVLMTWKKLIKQQRMQITRYQNSTENFLIDDRYPVESRYRVSYDTLDDTTSGSLVNCSLDTSYTAQDSVFLVTTIATNETTNSYGVSAPSGSGLPDVYSRRPTSKHFYLLNYVEYNYFNVACIRKDSTASFVISALWLPFKPSSTSGFSIVDNVRMFAGTDALTQGKTWEDAGSSIFTFVATKELDNGVLPYLVIKDFTFPSASSFLDYKPFAMYEMYIPFVGYISLEMSELFGKRCIIYYSLDPETGNATCYLYNITNKKCVFSQPCQLGMKMEFNTANFYETNIQRELFFLNCFWGGVGKGASAGISFATGNYGSGAKNVVDILKTATTAPLQESLIVERMSSSFGSGENGMYTLFTPYLKITYRSGNTQEDITDYEMLEGKPYNKYVERPSGTITGYVEVGKIHFDPMGEDIYQDEISEIVELLQNGVIF